MSIESVRKHLKFFGRDNDIIEMPQTTETVDLAAKALGTQPAQIAKTLAIKGDGDSAYIVVVCAGDLKIDNKKFRDQFGIKPRMLGVDETYAITGHEVGGVCPFALPQENNITLAFDVSLKMFDYVYPACGSKNSSIKLTVNELIDYSGNPVWVDVCKPRELL